MEQKDASLLFKKLVDEACDYIKAGMTLHQFYKKHEKSQADSNMIIKHSSYFNNMFGNFPFLKEIKKPKFTLEQNMQAYLDVHPVHERENPMKIVTDAGHGKCLDSLYRILF